MKNLFTVVVLVLMLVMGQTASGDLVSNTTSRADGRIIVRFTGGTGTWTVPAGVTNVEVLVVGGGGGGAAGGTWNADGGGAGGLVYTNSYNVTAGGSISVTVGTGGVARSSYGDGNSGNNSVFGQLIAYGGEGGLQTRGGNQGGYSIDAGTNITSGKLGATHAGSNGGGGAGANGFGNFGASYGGDGVQNNITGTMSYYAGGGGGGYSGDNNSGGLGGGGKGASEGLSPPELNGPGHGGTNGLGGGGGASRDNVVSGAGGSGIVILSYPDPNGVLVFFFR